MIIFHLNQLLPQFYTCRRCVLYWLHVSVKTSVLSLHMQELHISSQFLTKSWWLQSKCMWMFLAQYWRYLPWDMRESGAPELDDSTNGSAWEKKYAVNLVNRLEALHVFHLAINKWRLKLLYPIRVCYSLLINMLNVYHHHLELLSQSPPHQGIWTFSGMLSHIQSSALHWTLWEP